jgi:hypothetical protein
MFSIVFDGIGSDPEVRAGELTLLCTALSDDVDGFAANLGSREGDGTGNLLVGLGVGSGSIVKNYHLMSVIR